jgi:hypothetical protein
MRVLGPETMMRKSAFGKRRFGKSVEQAWFWRIMNPMPPWPAQRDRQIGETMAHITLAAGVLLLTASLIVALVREP